ncbi:MAG: cyclic dehypoxanthinyl futalosine synthase [bacterium]|nr:cyclic dehypoxanthinyl futalosine synthase [bacterium]
MTDPGTAALGMEAKTLGRKIARGARITPEEGVMLLEKADLLSLGEWANLVRNRKHPDRTVTFVIDRNINYTNVCINRCRFCAFYRSLDDEDAYLLSREAIFSKIEETLEQGGTQILMQGGIHPDLSLDYFDGLFRSIKNRFPIQIHALSPPEIVHVSRQSSLSIPEVLVRLKEAGLDSIPGGGAEILVDRVRQLMSPRKISAGDWLQVMQEAHGIGLPSTATMMFGSLETAEEIMEHLIRIRQLQDETHGFTAFIPWSYQPGNTDLQGESATGMEYLKILAVSRIVLDNVDNIQASWVTQGPKMGQVALFFGANDMGSTMLEENVVAATGVSHAMTPEEIVRLIANAGFRAAQRNTTYGVLKYFD